MGNLNTVNQDEQIKYSKIISSMLCSASIVSLSILCLLNNLTLDMYSALCLLKIVIPASICFWFIGFVIGKILDGKSEKIIQDEINEGKIAYEIPSMFAASSDEVMDDIEVL